MATFTGTANSDVLPIYGDGGNNELKRNGGNDLLAGKGGNDTHDGGNGTDSASYGDATGNVKMDLAAGTASGGAGTDKLISIENVYGGKGSEVLLGDGQANVLIGSDTFDGKAGADTFGFSSARHRSVGDDHDVIAASKKSQGDKIDLDNMGVDSFASGNQDFTFIGTAKFFALIAYLRSTNTHCINPQESLAHEVLSSRPIRNG